MIYDLCIQHRYRKHGYENAYYMSIESVDYYKMAVQIFDENECEISLSVIDTLEYKKNYKKLGDYDKPTTE
jgi:hypothetical protein